MSDCAHFYHAYAAGAWQEPVAEHLFALQRCGFDGPLHLGLVGPRSERRLVADTFAAAGFPAAEVTEASRGFEQVTLRALHDYGKRNSGAVLYAHTKGAARPSRLQPLWRRSMTATVLGGWRAHTEALQRGEADVIGCHWLRPEDYPGAPELTGPLFAGNFWIASCDHLAALPAPLQSSRFDAERWVGQNDPAVIDLRPGWPNSSLCRAPLQVGRLQVAVDGELSPAL